MRERFILLFFMKAPDFMPGKRLGARNVWVETGTFLQEAVDNYIYFTQIAIPMDCPPL